MARGVNKVILVGNIGQDPETRYSANGAAITNISVATSESWKDKQTGEQQERTEWHRVVFFNRLAEIAGEYLRKGSKVYVEGALRTRKWQDNEGKDRYSTEIVASEMQMLDSRGQNDGMGGGMNQSAPSPSSYGGNQNGGSQNQSYQNNKPGGFNQGGGQQPSHQAPALDTFDDDIPF